MPVNLKTQTQSENIVDFHINDYQTIGNYKLDNYYDEQFQTKEQSRQPQQLSSNINPETLIYKPFI